MKALVIMPGAKFGRYTVMGESSKRAARGQILISCRCDCGKIVDVFKQNLIRGNSKSCGCLGTDHAIEANTTHGLCYHPLYDVWLSMRGRCKSKDPHKAKSYLDRGITFCKEWNDFNRFYEDMSPTWKPGLWLERINNNLSYSKENCRWATPTEQARNKTNNRILTVNGQSKTMSEWAEIKNIHVGTIFSRLKAGWSDEDAVNKPIRHLVRPTSRLERLQY